MARAAGQLVGVGHAEHDAALHRRERPQADPVRQVGVQAAQPALLEALRGQQQVHAERPADPADHHEQVDEVGLRREQLAELVADDEQARQRVQRLTGRPRLLVLEQRDVVAGRAQQLLAAHHLAGQRGLHAVDQRQLVGEVGDDRARVRQHVERGERRATLEVHQDEVELLGRVRDRQRRDHRAQQLALARAGGADQQAVRPHALLRRLLDVQLDDRPSGPTPSGMRSRSRLGRVRQVTRGSARRRRRCRAGRAAPCCARAAPRCRRLGGEPERRQLPGQARRSARSSSGPAGRAGWSACPDRPRRCRALTSRHSSHRPASAVHHAGQVDDGGAEQAGAVQRAGRVELAAVEDDDHVRRRLVSAPGLGRVPGPLGDARRSSISSSVGHRSEHQTHRDRRRRVTRSYWSCGSHLTQSQSACALRRRRRRRCAARRARGT